MACSCFTSCCALSGESSACPELVSRGKNCYYIRKADCHTPGVQLHHVPPCAVWGVLCLAGTVFEGRELLAARNLHEGDRLRQRKGVEDEQLQLDALQPRYMLVRIQDPMLHHVALRATSLREAVSASGKVSTMNGSILMPCRGKDMFARFAGPHIARTPRCAARNLREKREAVSASGKASMMNSSGLLS